MTVHAYKIINAEGQQIGRIITSEKNKGQASMKLKRQYGANAAFLKLEYSGIVEVNTTMAR